jgi:orotate phosphoribosyltransferase
MGQTGRQSGDSAAAAGTAAKRRAEFIRFAVDAGVLRFGSFRTKAGRDSPYFFNAGLFNDGARLGALAGFYADTLLEAERAQALQFDMLFGPAYKGITLASATAVALAARGRNVPFAFNRKEAKDHGEGGTLVGAPLAGRVVIVDDVISAGTSVNESVELIRAAGAQPAAVLIALDRMEVAGDERSVGGRSAVQEVQSRHGLPVVAIATLDDLLGWLGAGVDTGSIDARTLAAYRQSVAEYRERYGAQ